jgi:hypothetical protein
VARRALSIEQILTGLDVARGRRRRDGAGAESIEQNGGRRCNDDKTAEDD